MTARHTTASADLRAWLLHQLTTHHIGAANAITWWDLGEVARANGWAVERDERNLREEVAILQAGDGVGPLIVSSSRAPCGVFVAATMAEMQCYLGQIRSKAAALAVSAARLRDAEIPYQGTMFSQEITT